MAYANACAAQAAAANANAAAARRPRLTLLQPLPPPRELRLPCPLVRWCRTLPPDCTSTVINGTNYFNCDGVYYKAGFQGNNVVYIVSTP